MPPNTYDVIVVGAGPAGCVLSYLLAKSGTNVLLIERDASFEREFRGPAYQPCVIEYFNEMGILDEVLTVDHSTLHHFSVTDSGRPLFTLDLDTLPPPCNYVIAMEQGPLLRKLIQLASEFPNLTFLGNTSVTDLITTFGMVTGVKAMIDGEEKEISSRLVVAADGRFSTVREAANIKMKKVKQQFDVVWFDFPAENELEYELGLEISAEGIVVFIPQEKGHVRVGWVLEKGGFAKLQKEGIEKFRNRLIAVKPILKEKLPETLKSFDQCSYLDVKISTAKKWLLDGLLLIGDAAHTASPVGAQGNKLAVQDAVAVHPYIVHALKEKAGTLREYQLNEYVKARQVETKKIFRWQRFLGKMVLGIRNPIINKIRQIMFPMASKYLVPHLLKVLGYGYQKLSVARDLFEYRSDYGKQHRYYLLKVFRMVKETEDACSFYFLVPREIKQEFQYKPGQFITLRLLNKGQLHKRCYSLSSIPEEDNFLRITVKRVKGGLISNGLIDNLDEGSEILVLPPAGSFIASLTAKRYFMLAGGSGITPIMSLIRSLLKKEEVQQITLVYANHDAQSIIFKSELDVLQQQHSHKFKIIHNLTVPKPGISGLAGRLTGEKIKNLISSEDEQTEYYICGPKELTQLTTEAFNQNGVSEHHIHIEKFTSLAEPFESVHGAEEDVPLIVGDSTETDQGDEKHLSIKLEGQEVSITCKPHECILDAAIGNQLNPPFSCREGICGTCIAQLKSGKVVMNKHQALTEIEAKSGKILTCQARPLTKESTIDYD